MLCSLFFWLVFCLPSLPELYWIKNKKKSSYHCDSFYSDSIRKYIVDWLAGTEWAQRDHDRRDLGEPGRYKAVNLKGCRATANISQSNRQLGRFCFLLSTMKSTESSLISSPLCQLWAWVALVLHWTETCISDFWVSLCLFVCFDQQNLIFLGVVFFPPVLVFWCVILGKDYQEPFYWSKAIS